MSCQKKLTTFPVIACGSTRPTRSRFGFPSSRSPMNSAANWSAHRPSNQSMNGHSPPALIALCTQDLFAVTQLRQSGPPTSFSPVDCQPSQECSTDYKVQGQAVKEVTLNPLKDTPTANQFPPAKLLQEGDRYRTGTGKRTRTLSLCPRDLAHKRRGDSFDGSCSVLSSMSDVVSRIYSKTVPVRICPHGMNPAC